MTEDESSIALVAARIASYEREYNAFMLDRLDEYRAFAAELANDPGVALDRPSEPAVRARADEMLDSLRDWHDRHPPPSGAVWPPSAEGDFPRPDLPRATNALRRLVVEEARWSKDLSAVAAGEAPRVLFDDPATPA